MLNVATTFEKPPTPIHVRGSFESFYGHHRLYLHNPVFSNLGLCAVCRVHFMCHQELWPSSVDHPFSFLLVALRPYWSNTYRKLLALSIDLFFKVSLFQATFLIFFHRAVFSPYSLPNGLLLQYVALLQSRELVKV